VIDALSRYVASGVDFIDAFNAAWMRSKGIGRMVTFDAKHFSGAEGITVHAL
jgi:predicted nucleic acid-binding protein